MALKRAVSKATLPSLAALSSRTVGPHSAPPANLLWKTQSRQYRHQQHSKGSEGSSNSSNNTYSSRNGGSSFSSKHLAALASALALAATAGSSQPLRCEPEQKLQPRSTTDHTKLVLSADCGGTTTRLRIYRVDPKSPIVDGDFAPGDLLVEEQFPNLMFKSLDDIISLFLQEHCKHKLPTIAVLAVAGVVTDNSCRYTNLDWVVDGFAMSKRLGIAQVEVINDFVAQGYGMLTLREDEVEKLNEVVPRRGAPIACVGAGTGLGQCFLTADAAGEYHCYPSEGGHVEFAPRGEGNDMMQVQLLKYLKVKFSGWNRISVERVVSGKGICNIYEFLAYTYPHRVDKAMHKEFLHKSGDAGVVAKHAKADSLAKKALDVFASCYGAQCGSYAISTMPFRGLYITGGVSKKMSHIFNDPDGDFMTAYYDKGRVSTLLEQVPLFLVKNDDMGQRGAHRRAVQLLKEYLAGNVMPVDEESHVSDKNLLVAPRSVTYGGESNPEDEVASLIDAYRELAVRNRRITIHKEEEAEFAPLFSDKLFRLPRTGCRFNLEDWMHREMWISKNGNLCYRSKTTGEGLIYWTKEDLEKAEIYPVDMDDTCLPNTFTIQIKGFQNSFFAAETPEGRDYWIQQLQRIRDGKLNSVATP
mmetsp:Transcript_71187/g.148873  ORF Transcript_71187/g.148873 Transcript_71187/m.148873 type:complete len:642 (+) Transcript_71187:124-2049(+)